MRIHSDTLTVADLHEALPVGVHAYITPKGSRKRDHAFVVTLYVLAKDGLHRRYGNSGGYGRSDDVAATWDEWGIWMDRLYEMEPDILIGWYQSRDHFMEQTARHQRHIQANNKPDSVAYRTQTAPWLEGAKV